jgi:hypothetical protein
MRETENAPFAMSIVSMIWEWSLIRDFLLLRPKASQSALLYLARRATGVAELATPCSSMRNERERRPARDPGPAPIASPFFSRWRPEARSPALPFHNFLRANAERDRAKDSVAFFAARPALVRPGFARDDQLGFASRLISDDGGGLKLLRPAPVLSPLEKR